VSHLTWLALAAFACGGKGPPRRVADDAPAKSLVGAWDTRMILSHPYPLAPETPAGGRVCGTIGLVENRSGFTDMQDQRPLMLGVYDLNLKRFGLNWMDDASFPMALAMEESTFVSRGSAPGDSITIVLAVGTRERLALRGRHSTAGIDGTWVAKSARGAATGVFSMRKHRPANPIC